MFTLYFVDLLYLYYLFIISYLLSIYMFLISVLKNMIVVSFVHVFLY